MSEELIELEQKYVISRAEGIYVYSPEGTRYIDFLSAYSAVNQGHGHPKLLKALVDQASQVTLTSRAFHNSVFPQYAKYVTEYFGYDMVLPMNTGAEGVETAIKLARKWGYMRKEIGPNQAIILGCADNFHGRTMTAVSLSTDPQSRGGFGPYLPGVGAVCPETGEVLKYGNVADLERFFRRLGKRLAGFLVEPIQGEAGIIIPPDEFLKRAYQLCNEHNVLFIADEIQTGIARTGKMLAIEHVGIRPDVLILGKALSGGMYPVSAVLADEAIMKCIQPGEHGSTYGGNPLACAVAMAALQIVKDENLVENAAKMGQKFRDGLNAIKAKSITTVRGRGLLNAIEISHPGGKSAWDFCLLLKKHGILAKPTHDTIVRLAPPLCITAKEIDSSLESIKAALAEFECE